MWGITASKVYDVLRTDRRNPSKSLLQEILSNNYNSGKSKIPALNWGIEHESDAIKDLQCALSGGQYTPVEPGCVVITDGQDQLKTVYFFPEIKSDHSNLCILKAGLRINVDIPYIGASADRLISCDCCGTGLIEVKCPYSRKAVEPSNVDMWNTLTLWCGLHM